MQNTDKLSEKRLIDANTVKSKAIQLEGLDGNGIPYEIMAVPVDAIDETPNVDATEAVHGYWKKRVTRVAKGIWGLTADCSVCGRLYPKVDHTGQIERFHFPPGLDKESFAVNVVLRKAAGKKLVPYCCYCGAKMDGGSDG